MGEDESAPAWRTCSKAGDSGTWVRTYHPTSAMRLPNKNGIRQPHRRSALSETTVATSAPTAEPNNAPIWALNPAQLPIYARYDDAACSTRKVTEPVNSPPTDNPWRNRHRVSASGAAMPIVS